MGVLNERMYTILNREGDPLDWFEEYVSTTNGVIKEGILVDKETILAYRAEQERNAKRKKQQEEYMKKFSQLEADMELLARGGGFYFSHYNNLIKQLDGDYATGFRFLYLCSFANDKGALKLSKQKHMTKNDIYETLKLSKRAAEVSVKKMIELKLIECAGNRFYVSEKYYERFQLSKCNHKQSTRVFNYGIQELYEQCLPKEHKTVGKIIGLLPYVHVTKNILCRNVVEECTELVEPLSSKDISAILGYNKTSYSRLIKMLRSIKVNDKPLVMQVGISDIDNFIINPYVFYKGGEIEEWTYEIWSVFGITRDSH